MRGFSYATNTKQKREVYKMAKECKEDKPVVIEEGVETTCETLDEITNGKGDDE